MNRRVIAVIIAFDVVVVGGFLVWWFSRPAGPAASISPVNTTQVTAEQLAEFSRTTGVEVPPGATPLGLLMTRKPVLRVLLKLSVSSEAERKLLDSLPSIAGSMTASRRQMDREESDPPWWDPDRPASFQCGQARVDEAWLRLLVCRNEAGTGAAYVEWTRK